MEGGDTPSRDETGDPDRCLDGQLYLKFDVVDTLTSDGLKSWGTLVAGCEQQD